MLYKVRWSHPWARRCLTIFVLLLPFFVTGPAFSQSPPSQGDEPVSDKEVAPVDKPKLGEPAGAKRLDPKFEAWIDGKNKEVILGGEICLREGMLEMFACTSGTKEHESIVSLNTKAYLAHAALLALGAKPGSPAQFKPEYKPASGTEIDVFVEWIDEKGQRQKVRAQEWVYDVATEKAMTYPWVFAGSGFWTDESTGEQYYQAEGGDFICVSNFPTAMLDLPVQSTDANEGLLFKPFTDRIPPLGTKVHLLLKPRLDKKGTSEKKAGSEKTGGP